MCRFIAYCFYMYYELLVTSVSTHMLLSLAYQYEEIRKELLWIREKQTRLHPEQLKTKLKKCQILYVDLFKASNLLNTICSWPIFFLCFYTCIYTLNLAVAFISGGFYLFSIVRFFICLVSKATFNNVLA